MNPNKTARANSIRIIGNKNKNEFFNECNKMEFHNLTAHDKPTMDVKKLLGSGPKFCAEPRGM